RFSPTDSYSGVSADTLPPNGSHFGGRKNSDRSVSRSYFASRSSMSAFNSEYSLTAASFLRKVSSSSSKIKADESLRHVAGSSVSKNSKSRTERPRPRLASATAVLATIRQRS